jgi:hypothetical protein
MSESLQHAIGREPPARKTYSTPDLVRFGTIRDLTGHCTTGCNHDSNHANEFYKPPDPL